MVKTENELPISWQQHIMLDKCHSGPRMTKGKEPLKSRSINRLLSRLQTDRLHDTRVTTHPAGTSVISSINEHINNSCLKF